MFNVNGKSNFPLNFIYVDVLYKNRWMLIMVWGGLKEGWKYSASLKDFGGGEIKKNIETITTFPFIWSVEFREHVTNTLKTGNYTSASQ